MKNKMHNVTPKKSNKITFKIKQDPTKLPNKMHFDIQLNCPTLIQESKKNKKPKYKHKVFEED